VMLAVVAPPDVLKFTAAPALLPSIWNWTVPVGVPAPGPCTLSVAVNVTAWPDADGLAEDTITVVVFALPTVCVKIAVLVRRLPSPP